MITDKTPFQLSTLTGSLFSIAVTLDLGDLIKSLILGAAGTLASYLTSRLMKWIFDRKAL